MLPVQFLSIQIEIQAPSQNKICWINHFDLKFLTLLDIFHPEICCRSFCIVRSNYRFWESVNSVRSRCYFSAYIMHRVSVDRKFTHRFKKDGPLTQIKEGQLSPFAPFRLPSFTRFNLTRAANADLFSMDIMLTDSYKLSQRNFPWELIFFPYSWSLVQDMVQCFKFFKFCNLQFTIKNVHYVQFIIYNIQTEK